MSAMTAFVKTYMALKHALGFNIMEHSFNTYLKFPTKYYFLPCIRVVRNVSFSENSAYVANEWLHSGEAEHLNKAINMHHFTIIFAKLFRNSTSAAL